MKRSDQRILTTHVGRLQRPAKLTEAMNADPLGRPTDPEFARQLRHSVDAVVQEQIDAGIDIVCDGEFGKVSWASYLSSRLSGFTPAGGEIRHSERQGQDRRTFKEFYDWADSHDSIYYSSPGEMPRWQCTAPVTYVGQEALSQDIAALTAAVTKRDVTEAFMPSTAPGSVRSPNAYYASTEEYLFALANALREEYQAIVDAGLILQVDDPVLPITWDDMLPDVDPKRYYEACEVRIESLNHALVGIPRDRVRYHVCWGSWHGPHSTDVPLGTVLPLLRRLNVGAWVFEAANVRHEHEWEVWKTLEDDDDRLLIPGVVSHSSDLVEHPELVAQRISRFVGIVGRERVIAGTDCGLGYRVHPQIAWAKLRSLAEGAQLAVRQGSR